jgi:Hydrogenase maturation factor
LPNYENIKVGDKLIVTKWLGLEGTNILVNELGEKAFSILTKDEIELSKQIINNISVVKEGKVGIENGALYMHDITEGGLYGAIWEASNAIGKGIRIYEEKIPVLEVTKKICEFFGNKPI